MQIHQTTLTYDELPSVMLLLDTTIFMWIVLISTLALVIWLGMKFWQYHSLPKVIAKKKNMAQTQFIFWLCMLGLVWKELWVLAVLAITIDWSLVQQWIRGTRQ